MKLEKFLATSPGLTQKLDSYPSTLVATPFIYALSTFPAHTKWIFRSIPILPVSVKLNPSFVKRELYFMQLARLPNDLLDFTLLVDPGDAKQLKLRHVAAGTRATLFFSAEFMLSSNPNLSSPTPAEKALPLVSFLVER
ncbi:MAG: hypothetical protein DRQ02_05655 [Candidatus Latescibacterota bacterium]|nr:MAG: hypothetical protein DRQ02_05655 [Candidatus Latescibacterota bacterium]